MRADSLTDEVALQRNYYARTAADYDERHISGRSEHDFALAFMSSMIEFLEIRSVLDIGSGTGRALLDLKASHPGTQIVGIEPSAALREMGYAKGLSQSELIDGDAQNLPFAAGEFDLVCEFGALHHIPGPHRAVAEMLRIAGKAVFISDVNNFGQGGSLGRAVKQALRALGLWGVANFLKTRGKGYSISEGDGLFYSYSVFNDYKQISQQCSSVHVLNTLRAGINPYRSAPHVALLGIK
jgi:ubiquinone/menaquinone biosynthesis C-methylase UbiE